MNIKANRILAAILLPIQWAITVYAMSGVVWCWNIFVFVTWLLLICTIIVMLAGKNTKATPRLLPASVTFTSDISLSIFVASQGHFGYATLVFIQGLLEAGLLAARSQAEGEKQ
jgi:hypothetical protein